MDGILLQWRDYRYFPYEREFARRETRELFGSQVRADDNGLLIARRAFSSAKAERLTYCARAVTPEGGVVIPRQTRLESSVADGRRQSTRYSAHGLHEYRGRFNPQVVRAIGNILGLEANAHVLDPFAGSGTTLLECAHAGWHATGVDRNPLAYLIATAKLRALRAAGGRLQDIAARILQGVSEGPSELSTECAPTQTALDRVLGPGWESELKEWEYLSRWFPRAVLAQVVSIRRCIVRSNAKDLGVVFDVILSDLLRASSHQDPADLRIRRRKDPFENYPLAKRFAESVADRVGRIVRAREVMGPVTTKQQATQGDVRKLEASRTQRGGQSAFDAVITSPPYETALPYIDTQRLSLVLLGLVRAKDVAAEERSLIGARDIDNSQRYSLEAEIEGASASVPTSVADLCRELLSASRMPNNGFRRQSRPALARRYFLDMAACFRNMRAVLAAGAPVALVVGANQTTLGGKSFVIDTPRLLRDVAMMHGFEATEEIPMETYPRYDVHQKNSIMSERLVVLRAS